MSTKIFQFELEMLYSRMQHFVDELAIQDQVIFKTRILSPNVRTLQSIARDFGLTKEAIRQRQALINKRIQRLVESADFASIHSLDQHFDEICSLTQLVHFLEDSLSDVKLDLDSHMLRFLASLLMLNAGYQRFGDEYVSDRVLKTLETLKQKVNEIADEYGHIDHWELLDAIPYETLKVHHVWFVEKLRLNRELSSYANRSNRSAKLNAAHAAANRPLARTEACTMCEITNKIASSVLSNTENLNQVSRLHWAPTAWRLHQYQGIVNEMLAYIQATGNMADRQDLIREISSKFDVKPESLYTYLQTPKFEVFGDYVSVVQEPTDGGSWLKFTKGLQQTREGNLTFSFLVHARHFRGFSVVCVPYIFARRVGCPFDGATTLQVANLPGCEITIQSFLASTTQASIGYVAKAFRLVKLEQGDRAYFEFKAPGIVELHRHQNTSFRDGLRPFNLGEALDKLQRTEAQNF